MKGIRKGLSFIMTVIMLCATLSIPAFANICEHHLEHTVQCGYVEAVEGLSLIHIEMCIRDRPHSVFKAKKFFRAVR